MIITYIYSRNPHERFSVHFRCRNLAGAINRTPGNQAFLLDIKSFVQMNPHAKEICEASDILVISRHLYGPVLSTMQYWKARDKKIVVDFNDAFQLMPPGTKDYQFWIEGISKADYSGLLAFMGSGKIDPVPIEQFKWGLKMADAATASTSRLAQDWNAFANVHVVPDFLNNDHYLTPADEKPPDELYIGFASNRINESSIQLSGVLKAIEYVAWVRPAVRVLFPAVNSSILASFNIPSEQVVLIPPISFERWPRYLSQMDVGLGPLNDDYDLRVSCAGLLEFMVMKIPWIASSLTPYRELAPYGRLVANRQVQWEQALLEILDRYDRNRQDRINQAYLFALSKDVKDNIANVLSFYTSLL